MTDRLHVTIAGRVQGVGFRFATCLEAQRLGLNGWVCNLPDGRVEAEFEGTKEALTRMLEWCQQGPRLARVARVDASWESGEPRSSDFEMRGW